MLTVDLTEIEVEVRVTGIEFDSASKAGISLFKIIKLTVNDAKINPGINVVRLELGYPAVMTQRFVVAFLHHGNLTQVHLNMRLVTNVVLAIIFLACSR